MKMLLGMEVHFSLGHIVLDGTQLPAKWVQQPALFGPSQVLLSSCTQWAMLKGRLEIFATFSVTKCKATWLKFHQILLVILLVTQ